MEIKSPFYVVEEFISPLVCEDILDACNFTVPDTNKGGEPILTVRTSDYAEGVIYDRLTSVIPTLTDYYGISYKGTEPVTVEWYSTGSDGSLNCENSHFLRGKWLRTKQRDLTGVLFLVDYQDIPPVDLEFEVYGGKLEFPQHHFGFNPKRGTLIVFPSDPHFINKTSRIFMGDLFQVRIQIAAKTPYIYNPQTFPGNYTQWFASLLSQ